MSRCRDVETARAPVDMAEVGQVGIDETASRRGHSDVRLFVGVVRRRVLFATPGRGAETVTAFAADLAAHGGVAAAVTAVCQDTARTGRRPLATGVAAALPNAEVTFDTFPVLKVIHEAVDDVRRLDQKHCPDLKHRRYLWLKNPGTLTAKQTETLAGLTRPARHLKTARADRMRLAVQERYTLPADAAEPFLKRWYDWATHSRLPPMVAVAKTIKRQGTGILNGFTSDVDNGLLEALNSLIQAAKAKARGDRSNRNLIAMIYLTAGKLGALAHAEGGTFARSHPHDPTKSRFFPSISFDDVVKSFLALGYRQNVATLLAQICTLDNSLPQGAPSSPALSNLVFRDTDIALNTLASKNRLRYTRYADDMTFSSPVRIENEILKEISITLNNAGFQLNTKKLSSLEREIA